MVGDYLIADLHVIDRIYIVKCGVILINKKMPFEISVSPVATGAIISELHYYGHIYMTCLLFFKEKI